MAKTWINYYEYDGPAVYCLSGEDRGFCVDVDQETLDRWKRITEEHKAMEAEIAELYDPLEEAQQAAYDAKREAEWAVLTPAEKTERLKGCTTAIFSSVSFTWPENG